MTRFEEMWISRCQLAAGVLASAILCGGRILAQVTQRVDVGSGGTEANGPASNPSITLDGRYVAFSSVASNLVAGDANGHADVFIRDRRSGTTELVSISSSGLQGDDDSNGLGISMSADGRFVAFDSLATNLVAGDLNGSGDVFVRDRQAGTTELVSISSAGTQADSASEYPWISADGRYVAFMSWASNLVPGDTNNSPDIFVRDRQNGTTQRVSVSSSGAAGCCGSRQPSMTPDGRFVAFESLASDLVPGDANYCEDIFVHDLQTGITERISISSTGQEADGPSIGTSTMSADGRYVAFRSLASNLVVRDSAFWEDIFVHDRLTGATQLVSVPNPISGPLGQGNFEPLISADGRYVGYSSMATNVVPGDDNDRLDVFMRDLRSGTTERVSLSTGSVGGNDTSYATSVSPDGRFVAFASWATNLVAGDGNGTADVFIRDRTGTGFVSVCEPGIDGAFACPCSNPSSGPGRGCDNSSGTGGASLSASQIAYLSIDSLEFTTSGEPSNALSILVQGRVFVPGGAVYGQGVRCVGGSLTRLFVKTAVLGSITAPDFTIADPTVSARSASLGDQIQAGEDRWYFVSYRDPVVPGNCGAMATFNTTQTGRITWWP